MRKNIIRSLSALLVVVLALSAFPMAAFADASEAFFLTDCGGFRCTGSGKITATKATATFTATALSFTPTIPDEMCSSKVWLLVYDYAGELMGATTTNGTTNATATYIPSGTVTHTFSTFEFMGEDLGKYILMNSQD